MSESMKAVVITQPGAVEVLELRDVERPTPGGRDILVRVASSGLNRADLLQRRGLTLRHEGILQTSLVSNIQG